MSLKLEASNESSPAKSPKTKKRTSKARKITRNSVKRKELTTNKMFENKDTNTININSEDWSENYSNGSYAIAPYKGGISGSMSEIVMGKGRNRLNTSNSSMKSDSYCQYQCTCKVVKKCKDKIDFNLLTRNNKPIKLSYPQRDEKTSGRNYILTKKTPSQLSITRKNSVYDNLNSLKSNPGTKQKSYKTKQNYSLNCERINSDTSSSSYISPYNVKRKNPQHQVPCRSNCCDCFNFEPFKICRHIQLCKCNCSFPCKKVSSSSLQTPKSSFCSSQSCPQLDVIKEEDIESEDLNSRSSSMDIPSKPEPRSKTLTKGKKQKTLEDSCADFLSIICDNILESVQKSVDKKVIEFNSESKEKFEELNKKLDENEIRLKNCCQEMMEKMTQQNDSYFKKIYSLIQTSLMETKVTNQCQDNECQYETVVNEEKKEDNNKKNNIIVENAKDEINGRYKIIGCGCCKCVIEDKSYPDNGIKEIIPSPSPQFTFNVPLSDINTGNLMGDLSNMAEIIKDYLRELKTPKVLSPMGSNIEIHENIDLNTKFPLLNDNSHHNFRNESKEEDLNIIKSFPVKNVNMPSNQIPFDETSYHPAESRVQKNIISSPKMASDNFANNNEASSRNSIKSSNSKKYDQSDSIKSSNSKKSYQSDSIKSSNSKKSDQSDSIKSSNSIKADQSDSIKSSNSKKLDQSDSIKSSNSNKADQSDSIKSSNSIKADQSDSTKSSNSIKADQSDFIKSSNSKKSDQSDSIKSSNSIKADQSDFIKSSNSKKSDQSDSIKSSNSIKAGQSYFIISSNSKKSDQSNTNTSNDDNYDTSGYTSEPEDNADIDSTKNGRKKLLKKVTKQSINVPVTLRVVRKSDSMDSS